MHLLEAVLRGIDSLIERTGKIVSWLILVMILTITYDVAMRYIFSAPTIWSFDTNYMLGGTLLLIGLSYVHLKKSHVRVDIISNSFPPKAQLIISILFRLVFFFPFAGVLTKISLDKAIRAWQIHEISRLGMWHPSMIPFRMVMLIAFLFLLLEGVSQFISDLLTLTREK